MDTAQFWQIIADSKANGDGECETQARALFGLLNRLPGDEIIAFHDIFNAFRARAYRWDLWGAAVIINGGASDDGFEYFRWWLIGQGEQTYEAALRDPDTLADSVDPAHGDYECEDILSCVADAYEAAAGQEMPHTKPGTPANDRNSVLEPAGTRWQEDELDALFPRLCALYDGAADADDTTL